MNFKKLEMQNLRRIGLLTISLFLLLNNGYSQKKRLDHSTYELWKRNQGQKISNDGKKVGYEIKLLNGDGRIYIIQPEQDKKLIIERGRSVKFSSNSSFATFNIYPQKDSVLKMKRKKIKKDDLPKDSLGIYLFVEDSLLKYPRVKSYKMAEENSDWVAMLFEKELKKKESMDSVSKDTVAKDTLQQEAKEKDKGERLLILNPINNTEYSFDNIKDYFTSKKSETIGFIQEFGDSIDSVSVYIFKPEIENPKLVFRNRGYAEKLCIDDLGKQFSFIYSQDTIKEKVFELYFASDFESEPIKIADTLTSSLPHKWTVSKNGQMYFSEDGKRLFFGTACKPIYETEDTLVEEEKAMLDVWSWTDSRLQPHQLKELEKDKKKSYLALYDIAQSKVIQLADTVIEEVRVLMDGTSNWGFGYGYSLYRKLVSWEYPSYKDIYAVNLNTGEKKQLLQRVQYRSAMSPNGNYVVWFEASDSSWYCISVIDGKTISLTKDIESNFYNELNDMPAEPSPYGITGWAKDEKHVVLYDKFDLWKVDLTGKNRPECITKQYGRKKNIELRYVKLDREEDYIDLKQPIMLSGFNHGTKSEGFYSMSDKLSEPRELIYGAFHFTSPVKARDAEKMFYRKLSFQEYPEVWYSNTDFTDAKKISITNPQKDDYYWPTVELISWKDFNGDSVSGLLYKPEGFDETKKYPLLIYFYERNTDELHTHWVPSPSRSIINPALYGSNGYVVFIPDIKYEKGFPGKGAYNAIVSGAMSLASEKWIDSERMGIQGQSWGGYQVAYLVTQTNIFRCGMAGAPVSNMTSAYGGIRWGSGLCRAFQYEETQSRIGGSLWDEMNLYIENSPLFYADRVETPLLMMHNDGDGAVPWYQGIEYFNALRRLNKPVWMLVYNNEEHNLTRWPNRVDLSIRMMQFFDYYLKDEPMPDWMNNGVPAIDKGKKNQYKLLDEN